MTLPEKLSLIRNHHILLTNWGTISVPEELAKDPGELEYICNLNGTLESWISLEIIESNIPVTNWGNAPANGVAEGAMALLLAALKDMHDQIMRVSEDGWYPDPSLVKGTLKGLRVGIYGFGVIGKRFAELIRPFGSLLYVYDPYVNDFPDYCTETSSLEELFEKTEAIVIHAGLCAETKNSVTAELLAKLPDHGIVINTARGDILDQTALFEELKSGRLRAGLDVFTGKDRLEPGHPARKWKNCIFSAHQIERDLWNPHNDPLTNAQKICLDNISRFIRNEPLHFIMDRDRYLRST